MSVEEKVIELSVGIKYQGKLENGLPTGFGKLTWANGDSYEGEFK